MTTPRMPDQPDDRDDLVIRVNASGLSIFIRRWRAVLAWLGGIVTAVLAIVFSVKVMHGLCGARNKSVALRSPRRVGCRAINVSSG